MPVQFLFRFWMLATWLLLAGPVHAADPCPAQRGQLQAADTAARIVAIACREHLAWHRPFIDRGGRLASTTVSEAESAHLADGSEAWRRVAAYWQESGLLAQMSRVPGANECGRAGSEARSSPPCRAFVIDKPWSAAFVSWVMVSARLPGFRPSASHIGYVRSSVLQPRDSPWEVLDPAALGSAAAGDLFCYVRVPGTSYGHAGLLATARASGDGLQMHCDIVVAAETRNDPTVYLIGGNLLQGVTMRLLPLNRAGRFWRRPAAAGMGLPCSPDNEAGCSFNRQDWALLLRLKPAAALAALPPPPLLAGRGLPTPPEPACCVHCVVGSGVPRCPAADAR